MKTNALLVIDMQKFFFEEKEELNRTALVSNCRQLIEAARGKGIPIVYIRTIYRKDMKDWPDAWKKPDEWCGYLVEGERSAEFVDGLGILDDDIMIIKKRFSAFFNTNLDDVLRGMNVADLYFIGYAADVCVRLTAVDAYNKGYSVTLIKEGIESFREDKEESIRYLEWLINSKCITMHEFRQMNHPSTEARTVAG